MKYYGRYGLGESGLKEWILDFGIIGCRVGRYIFSFFKVVNNDN